MSRYRVESPGRSGLRSVGRYSESDLVAVEPTTRSTHAWPRPSSKRVIHISTQTFEDGKPVKTKYHELPEEEYLTVPKGKRSSTSGRKDGHFDSPTSPTSTARQQPHKVVYSVNNIKFDEFVPSKTSSGGGGIQMANGHGRPKSSEYHVISPRDKHDTPSFHNFADSKDSANGKRYTTSLAGQTPRKSAVANHDRVSRDLKPPVAGRGNPRTSDSDLPRSNITRQARRSPSRESYEEFGYVSYDDRAGKRATRHGGASDINVKTSRATLRQHIEPNSSTRDRSPREIRYVFDDRFDRYEDPREIRRYVDDRRDLRGPGRASDESVDYRDVADRRTASDLDQRGNARPPPGDDRRDSDRREYATNERDGRRRDRYDSKREDRSRDGRSARDTYDHYLDDRDRDRDRDRINRGPQRNHKDDNERLVDRRHERSRDRSRDKRHNRREKDSLESTLASLLPAAMGLGVTAALGGSEGLLKKYLGTTGDDYDDKAELPGNSAERMQDRERERPGDRERARNRPSDRQRDRRYSASSYDSADDRHDRRRRRTDDHHKDHSDDDTVLSIDNHELDQSRRGRDFDFDESTAEPPKSEPARHHFDDKDSDITSHEEDHHRGVAVDPDEDYRQRLQQAQQDALESQPAPNVEVATSSAADSAGTAPAGHAEGTNIPLSDETHTEDASDVPNGVRSPDTTDDSTGKPKARVRIVDPKDEKKGEKVPLKSILKQPKHFPEVLNPVREGVAPLKDAKTNGIPPGARWTKIDRRLVNPEALEQAKERFEERPDCVIVLRVLTKDEIQRLAEKTRDIRDARHDPVLAEKLERRRREKEEARRKEEEGEDEDIEEYEYESDDERPRLLEAPVGAPAPFGDYDELGHIDFARERDRRRDRERDREREYSGGRSRDRDWVH